MVEARPRLQLATEPAAGSTSGRRGPSRHRWHRRPWPHLRTHLRLPRSIVGTLVRLDDDPVLLCDCAEGVPHTCG